MNKRILVLYAYFIHWVYSNSPVRYIDDKITEQCHEISVQQVNYHNVFIMLMIFVFALIALLLP